MFFALAKETPAVRLVPQAKLSPSFHPLRGRSDSCSRRAITPTGTAPLRRLKKLANCTDCCCCSCSRLVHGSRAESHLRAQQLRNLQAGWRCCRSSAKRAQLRMLLWRHHTLCGRRCATFNLERCCRSSAERRLCIQHTILALPHPPQPQLRNLQTEALLSLPFRESPARLYRAARTPGGLLVRRAGFGRRDGQCGHHLRTWRPKFALRRRELRLECRDA